MKRTPLVALAAVAVMLLAAVPAEPVSAEVGSACVDADICTASVTSTSLKIDDTWDYPSGDVLNKTTFVFVPGSEKEKLFIDTVMSRDPSATLPESDTIALGETMREYIFTNDGTTSRFGITEIKMGSNDLKVILPKDAYVYRLYGIDEITLTISNGTLKIEDYYNAERNTSVTPGEYPLSVSSLLDVGYGPRMVISGYFDEKAVCNGEMTAMQAAFMNVSFSIDKVYLVGEEGTGGYDLALVFIGLGIVAILLKVIMARKPGWAK